MAASTPAAAYRLGQARPVHARRRCSGQRITAMLAGLATLLGVVVIVNQSAQPGDSCRTWGFRAAGPHAAGDLCAREVPTTVTAALAS